MSRAHTHTRNDKRHSQRSAPNQTTPQDTGFRLSFDADEGGIREVLHEVPGIARAEQRRRKRQEDRGSSKGSQQAGPTPTRPPRLKVRYSAAVALLREEEHFGDACERLGCSSTALAHALGDAARILRRHEETEPLGDLLSMVASQRRLDRAATTLGLGKQEFLEKLEVAAIALQQPSRSNNLPQEATKAERKEQPKPARAEPSRAKPQVARGSKDAEPKRELPAAKEGWRGWLPFPEPTPVQEQAIPHLLEGRDLITTARTGSGKTLAFLIPAAARGIGMEPHQGMRPEILVISPTRELAVQSRDVAASLGMAAGRITGGISSDETRREARGKGLVSGTPGRLKDLLQKGELQLSNLRYLVLDEADELLSLGFLKDVSWIAEEGLRQAAAAGRKRPQVVLASATFPAEIRSVAERLLREPARVDIAPPRSPQEHGGGQATHRVIDSTRQSQLEAAAQRIRQQLREPGGCVVVFCRTKALVRQRAELLQSMLPGEMVAGLQGNLDQRRREQMMDSLRSGRCRVLVATDIAGRGIDLPEVREVIHLDVAQTSEHHVHRSGRTARAGRSGENTVLLIPEQRALWQKVKRGLPPHLVPPATREEGRIDPSIQEKNGKGSGGGHGIPPKAPMRRGHAPQRR